jgi:hypothetical protein
MAKATRVFDEPMTLCGSAPSPNAVGALAGHQASGAERGNTRGACPEISAVARYVPRDRTESSYLGCARSAALRARGRGAPCGDSYGNRGRGNAGPLSRRLAARSWPWPARRPPPCACWSWCCRRPTPVRAQPLDTRHDGAMPEPAGTRPATTTRGNQPADTRAALVDALLTAGMAEGARTQARRLARRAERVGHRGLPGRRGDGAIDHRWRSLVSGRAPTRRGVAGRRWNNQR